MDVKRKNNSKSTIPRLGGAQRLPGNGIVILFHIAPISFRPLCAPHPSILLVPREPGNAGTTPLANGFPSSNPLARFQEPGKSESKMMFGRMLCIIGRQKFYLLEALVRKARCLGKCAVENRSNEHWCDAINAQQAL